MITLNDGRKAFITVTHILYRKGQINRKEFRKRMESIQKRVWVK